MRKVFTMVSSFFILFHLLGMSSLPQHASAEVLEEVTESWSSLQAGFGTASHIPIFHADGGIVVDGQLNDWVDNSDIHLPANNEQVQLQGWAGDEDLSLHAMISYDEDYFYLAATVTDNIHHAIADDYMWMGDSLQLAFGNNGVYGPEYGFSLVNGESQIWRWVVGEAVLDKNSITLHSSRSGNETVYEAAIPWGAIFSEYPDNKPFQFSLLVNDNDGEGRRGWIEWNESIGRVKDANKMSTLYPVPLHDEWSFWLNTKHETQPGENVPYILTIVNFSPYSKTLTLNSNFFDLDQQIELSPGEAVHLSSSYFLSQSGEYSADIELMETLTDIKRTLHVPIVSIVSGNDLVDRFDLLESQLPILTGLLQQAEAQGISTDYERVDYTILLDFINYGRQDASNNRLQRANYVLSELEKMYNQTINNLESYLSGTKEALTVPRYVTGPLELNGYNFIGDSIERHSGHTENNRPIFLNGYGHFDQVRSDIPKFQDVGANIVQVEIGPSRMLLQKDGNIPKFKVGKSGNVSGEAYIDETMSKSGNKSLKMVNQSPKASNVFVRVWQNLSLKANTTYTFKAWVKAEGLEGQNAWFPGGPNWSLRTKFPAGTYDWTELTASYTTGPANINTDMSFVLENIGTIWIDDIAVTEEGSIINIVENSGFEDFPNGFQVPQTDYFITTDRLEKDVLSTLQQGEEHNIAVNLLVSPHYFPNWILQKYPEVRNDGNKGFLKFNINHPKAKEVIEVYLRSLIPLVKDYPSLHSITLSNEPVYHANLNPAHLPDWHQYLAELYNNIDELNQIYLTNYTSFEEIAMPSTLGANPLSYDYMIFNSNLLIEWHQWMADIVHEIAPDLPVHVKIMTDLGPGLERGTDIEKFSKLSQINGNDTYNLIGNRPNSFRHEALIYDLQRSFNQAPVFNSEHHFIQDGDTSYNADQAIHAKGLFWQGAIHGRSASTAWVWERTYDTSSVFEGSLLHRPDVVAAIGKTNHDLNRLAYEVKALQDIPAQTAILYSLPSGLYNNSYFNTMYRSYEALSYAGQSIRFVSEDQIVSGGLSDYSLLVIPAATHVPEAVLTEIRHFVEQGGQSIMLGNHSLSFNEHNQPLSAADRIIVADHSITLDASGSAEKIRQGLVPLLEQNDQLAVQLKDLATDELSYGIEWRSVDYNGHLLINAINYSGQPKTVYLEVDGITVQALVNEKISGSKLNGSSITLEPWKPYLLELSDSDHSEIPEIPVKPIIPTTPDEEDSDKDELITRITDSEIVALLLSKNSDAATTPAAQAMTSFRAASDLFRVTLTANGVKSLEAELPYTGERLDERLLGIYKFNEVTNLWTYIGGNLLSDKQAMQIKLTEDGIYAVMEYDRSFRDVPVSHWAYPTVKELAALHIIKGVSDTNFNPNHTVTRAEFASLLVRALKLSTDGFPALPPFRDVAEDNWYAKDIAAVHAAGIATGVADGIFAPMQTITREQMAVMLFRVLLTTTWLDNKNTNDQAAAFSDLEQVSNWALKAVQTVAQHKLIYGRGGNYFAPKATATRAEAAAVIHRLLLFTSTK